MFSLNKRGVVVTASPRTELLQTVQPVTSSDLQLQVISTYPITPLCPHSHPYRGAHEGKSEWREMRCTVLITRHGSPVWEQKRLKTSSYTPPF